MNKEEIEQAKDDLKFFNEGEYITKEMSKSKELLWQYIKQLENKVKEQEELNNKYLQKLVYALTPTTHELSTSYNNAFKKIIAENIDLETCKIRRKLKECWGVDKY